LNWLILKTDHAKEAYVARQVANMGYDNWVPSQLIVIRLTLSRRVTACGRLMKVKELPILPRRLFAAIPDALQAEVEAIRHCAGLERDGDSRPLCVPDAEIARFRAAIDAENTAAMALAQKASRRQKAKWRDMRAGLLELIEGAKQAMEQAA
jgi:hypothetical protein